jgi:hypothetical protein
MKGARAKRSPKEPACVDCGCTMDCACIGFDAEPCHWASTDPYICSTCDDKRVLRNAATLLRQDAKIIRKSNSHGRTWDAGSEDEQAAYNLRMSTALHVDVILQKAGP